MKNIIYKPFTRKWLNKLSNLDTAELTACNLNKAIEALRKQKTDPLPQNIVTGLLLPVTDKKLSNRYRGRGRPRKSDYDYEEIDWSKING